MPYIPQNQRKAINKAIDALTDVFVNETLDDETANYEGMVNYALTRLMMNTYGDASDTRYSNINNAIGVLECCKLELYRMVAAPYEVQKAFENGIVTPRDEAEFAGYVTVEREVDSVALDLDDDKVRWRAEMTAEPKFSDLPQDLQDRFRKDVLESLDGSSTGSPALDTPVTHKTVKGEERFHVDMDAGTVDLVVAELPEEFTEDPRLSLKEKTAAESEELFNPPVIKTSPNPHTNAGYDEDYTDEDHNI